MSVPRKTYLGYVAQDDIIVFYKYIYTIIIIAFSTLCIVSHKNLKVTHQLFG